MKLHHRAYLLAAMFVASASAELGTFALERQWAKFTPHYHAIQLIEASLWLIAAFGLIRRSSWSWFPLMLATLSVFFHGWAIMVAADRLPALLFILTGAFGIASYRKLAVPWRGSLPFIPFNRTEHDDRREFGDPLFPERHATT